MQNDLRLDFEELNFAKFVGSDLSVNTPKLVDVVLQRSRCSSIEREQLVALIESEMTQTFDRLEMCCGHDAVEILAVGLRDEFGALRQAENSASEVSRSLFLAYESRHFQSSSICAQIKDWERLNNPFRVLKI